MVSLTSVFSLIKIAKILALMVLFFSLAHSSRTAVRGDRDNAHWVSKDSVAVIAREVPTGPDPLHHNIRKPNTP